MSPSGPRFHMRAAQFPLTSLADDSPGCVR